LLAHKPPSILACEYKVVFKCLVLLIKICSEHKP
jgi:hypothetical protein